MTPPTRTYLYPCAALLALVLAAFTAGWWIGRTGRLDLEREIRIAKLEEKLEELRTASRDPNAGSLPSPTGAPAPVERGITPDKVHEIDLADSPASGPPDAPVTIVEFSDFECPFCASAHPTLERILAEYRGRVRLVFKHNPLPFHRNALLAHRAAVAAHRQGRFWEMHDLLFASQDRLDGETLKSHARALDLDMNLFEDFLASPESTQAITADMSQAGKLGIGGVPAFFINGRFIAGAQPFEVFREEIQKELGARSKG